MVPVNPNATPEACELLEFIYSVKGKKTLSAQHDFISSGTRYCQKTKELAGKFPLIWGSDFSFYLQNEPSPIGKHHCAPINLIEPGLIVTANDDEFSSVKMGRDASELTDAADVFVDGAEPHVMRQALVETVKVQHAKGHIITLMWHALFPNPDGDCGSYNNLWMPSGCSQEQWMELVTPGTELHGYWLTQVDEVAGYLKQLCAARIPVLWRPYHEMNGVWFWWGNKPGPDGFSKLWKMLYERLTVHHGLNNLLWVWNTNAPRDTKDDEAFAYELFYPGPEWVDVLAADVYRKDYRQSHHDDLLQLADGKPIALAEVGELPPNDILDQQPGWLWVMPWGHLGFLYNSAEEIDAFYGRNNVLPLA